MKKYDFLIVGAGLFGATFAHLVRKAGRTCKVIDRRSVIGGNLYCEVTDGIPVHVYGAHIFHTSNKEVWNFVNSFVPFNRYTNSPVAYHEGKLYNLPFNLNTFYQLWGTRTPAEAQARLEQQRAEAVEKMYADGIESPRNLEEQALTLVGKDIYEKLIKGYTEKQWGRPCTELPAFIIRRLPVRLVFDNNYFNDCYQGIPEAADGYNTLISEMLSGAEVELDCDFFSKSMEKWLETADHIVYTGPVDRLLDYRFGPLAYRSVRFETETLDTPNYQGNAVVNYTEAAVPYTRIIEHKHFCTFGPAVYDNPKTVISREYSAEWQPGIEPFYPVNDEANSGLYEKYCGAAAELPRITVAGRLGQYRYFDMDKTIEEAFNLAQKMGLK